jgi:hypothetical protein
LIEGGADIHAKNTTGQTFLHVFKVSSFSTTARRMYLLKKLAALGFQFSQRDCHGQTSAHAFVRQWWNIAGRDQIVWAIDEFDDMCKIMDVDLCSMDNHGYRVGDCLDGKPESSRSSSAQIKLEDIRKVQSLHGRENTYIDFRGAISLPNWNASEWIESMQIDNWYLQIDVHGDTPLIAALKKWRNDEQEIELRNAVQKLMDLGVQIDVKDRKGHTALAIAAIRGARPSAKLLVKAGAKANSRNYRGKGIIFQASSRMRLAKKGGKDGCYARICSYINLLTDHGAKMEPNDQDEWLLPGFRSRLGKSHVNLSPTLNSNSDLN